jgi:PAS domain S-box-containing protein
MNVKLKQKYYEEIIANLPGHVYWKDKAGRFLGCNIQQAIDAGYQHPSDLIGKTDQDMPWRLQADYLREIDLKVMKSGRPISIEEVSEVVNGEQRIYLSNKLPLYDQNEEISGILGISIDITDRKQLEEDLVKAKQLAEAANEAKTEFLENMRHDIRTPLTGIVGFAEIIKQESNSERINEYADNLIAASHTLLDFLNEILEGIKVLTTEVPILKRKFDLSAMCHKIVDLMKPKALEKNLDLSICYDKNLPKFMIGDPQRIQRIIMELVSNALNFTNKGNVTIKIDQIERKQKEVVIRIDVSDTGIGIPEDKQEEIYVRFKRLIPSYKGIYKGAGLGLSIIKQFIDDLYGEIYCSSQEGKGSTFTCLLCLQESLVDSSEGAYELDLAQLSIPSVLKGKIAKKKVQTDKTRVLVVEDQLLAAKVAQSIISNLGCSVDVAPDGKTALRFVSENKYDLIFMDVGLPDTTGYEVTKQIRANEWKLDEHIPIVALTAHIDTENKQACIYSGMDAVISKPLMANTAKDILNAFVPARNTEEADKKVFDKEKLLLLQGEVIDEAEGITKMNGDEKAAKEMMLILIEGLKEETPNIVKAKANDDWKTISAIAHKLRGGCSYCGVPRLRQACANIEDYLNNGGTELREELYQQLMEEIIKVIAHVS